MKQVQHVKLDDVKLHDVLFVVTSPDDYDQSRIIAVYDDKLHLYEGYHCSCYEFEDTDWDYTELEYSAECHAFLNGWIKNGTDLQRQMARLLQGWSSHVFGREQE